LLLNQILVTILDSANFAVVVLAVAWVFRVVRFPDLSGDGTFVLGAFISAKLATSTLLPLGHSTAIIVAIVCGGVCGAICAILNTRVKIPNLLCGILMATALYSMNLTFLGRPNSDVASSRTIFASIFALAPIWRHISLIVTMLILFSLLAYILIIFMQTGVGIRMRAAVANPDAGARFGVNHELSLIIGLAIANAITALAGALFAQRAGFVSIEIGYGIVLQALAAVLLGEAVWSRRYTIFSLVVTSFTGAIIYKTALAITLRMGLNPYYQNLITVIIVVLSLMTLSSQPGDRLEVDVKV